MRIEGERALGKTFALRATVAYKGTWVRLVRTVCEPAIAREAAARFAAAVAQLPSDRGFVPASAPGWSKAAGWRSRSSR